LPSARPGAVEPAIAAIDHFLGLSLVGTADAAKRSIADLLRADNEPKKVIPLRPRERRR
jgi:hypothetical protein